jgi:amino acid adenylation domain-containing protein
MTGSLPPTEWNETTRNYPPDLIHESFAAQAARTPGAPAVRFRGESLTYMEMDERVGRLAAHLLALGVTPGTLVAVCMERSAEMVVALHAIVRAGGAYVPLDPEYPEDRLGFMLQDLDDPILLTQQRLVARFAGTQARVVPTDVPFGTPDLAPVPPQPVSGDDLAYVIYTSGSTGQPKGAMNSHAGIANRLHWMQEQFGLMAADKVLQKTPYSFDVSVWEFFWPLMVGAELVVAEPGGHRDTAYLTRTIIDAGITTIHFVPSMLQLFLEDPQASACTSLRYVVCSGEALPKAMQDRCFERVPHVELVNLYGPTEAAVDVSVWVCDRESTLPFVPIGRPIANTQLHILDGSLQQIPVGAVGDLYIGGVQVGLGYLNRPELTAERFIADPFRPGGRLYKTGDLARFLPDGNIEFLGRSDFQVKIRGFRIELGEIESALEAIDGVRGAVVVAHERSAGDLELVAYVAHPAGPGLAVDGLRSSLAERLPEYMVPTTIIPLERFPLNPNGKVDRKELPAPIRVRPELDSPFTPARTALERNLAERWRVLLDLDRVGTHDRFFELGGTSLGAARFVNQLQTEMGESILVITLFGAPTVAEYAALLERQFPAGVRRLLSGGVAASTAAPSDAGPSGRTDRRASLSRLRDRRASVQAAEDRGAR